MYATAAPHPVDRFFRRFFIGLYGWSYAVYFGLVTLDSIYSSRLNAAVESAVSARIFIEISDFLIMPFGVLFLFGASACGASLQRPRVLNPILISWMLLIVLLGLQPIVGAALDASGYGTTVRLMTLGSGSILAWIAVIRFHQPEIAP